MVRDRVLLGLTALVLVGGCATSRWTGSVSSAPAADVAAIESTLHRINDAYAAGRSAGADAIADANYYVVAGLASKIDCVRVWLDDPTFFDFLNDALQPETVTATPGVVPPDLGSVPRGRIYAFKTDEQSRTIGEAQSGFTGVHRTVPQFHATVMPDGSALLFVSCEATAA